MSIAATNALRLRAAADLRFPTHIKAKSSNILISIPDIPHEGAASFKCSAAGDVSICVILAFELCMCDPPESSVVLNDDSGIAALGVQYTAVQPVLLRRLENSVDFSSIREST